MDLAENLMWIAEATVGDVPLSLLTVYGPLGIFAAIFILFARISYQRETARSDSLEDENRRLNALIVDRVIPTLTAATSAVEENAKLLNAMQREREVMREAARLRESREGIGHEF